MTDVDAVVLRVSSRRYASDHPGWCRQVRLLEEGLRGLRSSSGEPAGSGVPLRVVNGDQTEAAGPTKGAVEIGAVALASAEVLRAVAMIIREWAKADASRKVEITEGRVTGRGSAGIDAALRAHLAGLDTGGPGAPALEPGPADDSR
ncbi:hypothetical protein [Actinoplanes sp. NPDC049265]|uniref:hypothetical protein n=1 Tax=Actinoplanes sp. NPDC049265 TaxID=3363902 RepID=UPI003723E4A7